MSCICFLYLQELPECDSNSSRYGIDTELCDIDLSRLLLENVFKDFHGNYSCEGMNDAGWGPRSNEAELIVHYPPGQAQIVYQPAVVKKVRKINNRVLRFCYSRWENCIAKLQRGSCLCISKTAQDHYSYSTSTSIRKDFLNPDCEILSTRTFYRSLQHTLILGTINTPSAYQHACIPGFFQYSFLLEASNTHFMRSLIIQPGI